MIGAGPILLGRLINSCSDNNVRLYPPADFGRCHGRRRRKRGDLMADEVKESLQESAAGDAQGLAAEPRGSRRSRFIRGFLELGPVWISAIGTLAAAVIAGVALLVSLNTGSKATPTAPSVNSLPPANVPPSGGICSQHLGSGSDANPIPISWS